MFHQEVKEIAKTVLLNTQRSRFIRRVASDFMLDVNTAKQFFPANNFLFLMYIITSSGDAVYVYFSDKVPLFFEHETILYPTVYMINKCPDISAYVQIEPRSVTDILTGAHLMATEVDNNYNFGIFQPKLRIGRPVYMNLLQNFFSTIAVGKLIVEPFRLKRKNTGKVIDVLHCFGDNLCFLNPWNYDIGNEGGNSIDGESGSDIDSNEAIESNTSAFQQKSDSEDDSQDECQANHTLKIQEFDVITKALEPIFREVGLKKGCLVKDKDFYKLLDRYFTEKQLQEESGQKDIKLNVTLCKLMNKIEVKLPREAILDFIRQKMDKAFKIKRRYLNVTQSIIGSYWLLPIDIELKDIDGKKMTVVSNLEQFAIDVIAFGEECKEDLKIEYIAIDLPNKKFCTNGVPNNGSIRLFFEGELSEVVKHRIVEKYLVPEQYIAIY